MRMRSLAGYVLLMLMSAVVVEAALDQAPSLHRHLRVRVQHQSPVRAQRAAVGVAADTPPPARIARVAVDPGESAAAPSPALPSVFVPPRS